MYEEDSLKISFEGRDRRASEREFYFILSMQQRSGQYDHHAVFWLLFFLFLFFVFCCCRCFVFCFETGDAKRSIIREEERRDLEGS